MSIWYCETHGLTGPGTQLPGICDHCGKDMSRATTAADDTTEYYSRSRIIINDKVAAETARCMAIIEKHLHWARKYPVTDTASVIKELEGIRDEIKGDV